MNDILYIIHADIRTNEREAKATDLRMQNLLEQCNEQSIKFQIVPGITKFLQTEKNINLTHKSIVRMAKDNGWDKVFIAEDDLKFTAPGSWHYFKSHLPESFDFFTGLIYHGTVENNRILSAFSGGMTLYCIHSRFYDDFLSIPDDDHIDRACGTLFAATKEMYCCKPNVVTQVGGYSFNLARNATYELYEADKEFYKG